MATVDSDPRRRSASPVCELCHDVSADVLVSDSVIKAVATAEGVDPTDCDLELYDAVDLESLDTLFEQRSFDDHWRFEFGVGEYVVVVDGDGRIAVYEDH